MHSDLAEALRHRASQQPDQPLGRLMAEAADALDPPLRAPNPPPFVVRAAVYVMFIAFVWLVMFFAVAGAAFVVSAMGGDVVMWLLGVPFGLFIAGAVVAVLGVVLTGWERGGG